MAERTVVGIDVGTYQVKVVVVRQPKKGEHKHLPQILGVGAAESRGMRHGYVVNPAEVAKSIRAAVAQAEQAVQVPIRDAYVSVGGIGLDEIHSHGEVITSRADSEITQVDIDKALADSEERIADRIPNRKILHAIPLSFTVDGEKVLGRAQGLHGTKLELDSLFITCFEQHINDLVGAIEGVGVAVLDVMASPLAASLVTLTKAQKRAGCVLANIGAETTSIVVYENGLPVSLKVFPIGSTDITNDIALGLKVPLEEAERVKRGSPGASGSHSKRRLDDIVAARLSDMFELVDAHLKKLKRDGLLPAGLVATGGGANIGGLAEVASGALRLPARVALLDPAQNGKVRDASFAVAYGLATWGVSGGGEESGMKIAQHSGNAFLRWMKQFLP